MKKRSNNIQSEMEDRWTGRVDRGEKEIKGKERKSKYEGPNYKTGLLLIPTRNASLKMQREKKG